MYFSKTYLTKYFRILNHYQETSYSEEYFVKYKSMDI